VYGETIECEEMICEREMSSAGGGKQLKKVMTECPMAENSRERMQLHAVYVVIVKVNSSVQIQSH